MNPLDFKAGIFLVTAANLNEAKSIAETLVSERLAACVSFYPLTSVYRWKEKIHCDDEVQLVIKANVNQSQIIIARVKELHSYDVPEIVAIPFADGLPAYLSWMKEQTSIADKNP